MKKLIFICLLAIIALSSRETLKAQITLEHTYDSAQTHLYMVNLEIEGMKYIWIDLYDNSIKLYNLDHSIFKIMSLPNVNYIQTPSIMYVSEHLFNMDDQIEFMYVYITADSLNSFLHRYHTKIINELGTIIFSADTMAPLVQANAPQTQLPIYNTLNGTKMILSGINTSSPIANVYSLTGHLSASIAPISFGDGNQLSLENIYPNPSNGNTTIEFKLPMGAAFGEIVIYNN